MLVSEITTVLKVKLVSGGTREYGIGDHIEVVCRTIIRDETRGFAGVLTKITPIGIRITDYNGNDIDIDIADIEEVIND